MIKFINYLLIIIGVVITFFLSLFVDFLMGKPLNYGYAIILGIFFGIIVFLIRYFLNKKLIKRS